MRIAVFENTANNAYIQAKAFHRRGIAIDLLLDRHDRFVMSDPRWEDADIELPTGELDSAQLAPAAQAEADWIRRPPPYDLPRPLALADHAGLGALTLPRPALRAARVAGRQGVRAVAMARATIRAMRDYDVVLGFGLGPAYARAAGVPCVMQTYGGDIDLVPFADTDDPDCDPFRRGLARLQRWGIEGCSAIAVTDPRFDRAVARLGAESKSAFVPFIVDTDKYRPQPEPELRAQLAAPDETLVFVPSRQDWYWKGSDRIIAGFARALAAQPSLRMLCAGWGADLARSVALAEELGVGGRIRFLEHAMSKTRLLRYFRAADIVIDQVAIGSYGTSALEAMSCGVPLVINLDRERFAGVFATHPPVAQAATAEEVAMQLQRLAGDPAQRARIGETAREWVVANHGDALVDKLLALCEAAVGSGR